MPPQASSPPEPALYLIATPIGNTEDITLRALRLLETVDVLACEDTRTTKKLCQHCTLTPKGQFVSYHDHNGAEARPGLLKALESGKSVALVSEAGTPLVSDPGYKLVLACLEQGHKVIPIPGASAALAGLTLSGLPSDQFLFLGFPPQRQQARRAWLQEKVSLTYTLILYESAKRLPASLADIETVFGARPLCLLRELTKQFESRYSGSAADLLPQLGDSIPLKGECVVVIGPNPEPQALTQAATHTLLSALLEKLSVKDAADVAAKITNSPKKDLYTQALALKEQGQNQ